VCGGIGVQVIRVGLATDSQDSASAPNIAAEGPKRTGTAAADSGAAPAAGSPLISSGRDYGPGTLGDLTGSVPQTQSRNDLAEGGGSGAASAAAEAQAPAKVPGLSRLAAPAARAACLTAITKEYGGQVTLVDYAAFEGQPALIVVVDGSRTAVGKRLVIVVGPDCGLGGAIADERYRTTTP
jgi:hypothetical protein